MRIFGSRDMRWRLSPSCWLQLFTALLTVSIWVRFAPREHDLPRSTAERRKLHHLTWYVKRLQLRSTARTFRREEGGAQWKREGEDGELQAHARLEETCQWVSSRRTYEGS